MDAISQALAAHVSGLSLAALPREAIHEAKKRLIDSVACAVGAAEGEPVRIVKRVARHYGGTPMQATILITGERVAADMAAFVNTAMVRYLDYNDSYIGPGDSGHPSDAIPAVLAMAEATGGSGAMVLLGLVAAYEGFCPFMHAVPLREQGWDHGLFTVLAAAMGAGKVLGLSAGQLAEAASLAVIPNVPARQTRAGALSFWKGTATAASSRAGLFAALLAQDGMTAPAQPFLGRHGIFENVAVDPGPIVFGGDGRPYGVELATIKSAPVESHLQAPIQAAIALRNRAGFTLGALESLEVDTYWYAYAETGSEPEKWHPTSRETADHSMPYVLASALIDGRVTVDAFAGPAVADPRRHDLMARIRVRHDQALTDRYPSMMPSRLTATLAGGEVLREQVDYPKGHRANPMTDSDVDRKFMELCEPVLGPMRSSRVLDTLWRIEDAGTLDPLLSDLTLRP